MSAKDVIVSDGGFSAQLSVHVTNPIDGDPLWSARSNSTNPEFVIQTHLDFLRAGAEVIGTNTYQASVEGFVEHLGLTKEQSVELIKSTVGLAHKAREQYLTETKPGVLKPGFPWIVGSIGPYGAHLHDGSEYSGKYADLVPKETIMNWHRPRIQAVVEAGVDALAIETIPCKVEAELLQELLATDYPNIKYWISFQCKDSEKLAHGESFGATINELWTKSKQLPNHSNLIALGVNCTHPNHIASLFKSANESRSPQEQIPFVVYPNSGEVYQASNEESIGWTGKDRCIPLENYAEEWIALGVRVIGGCCRTYAHDIQGIKKKIDELRSTANGQ